MRQPSRTLHSSAALRLRVVSTKMSPRTSMFAALLMALLALSPCLLAAPSQDAVVPVAPAGNQDPVEREVLITETNRDDDVVETAPRMAELSHFLDAELIADLGEDDLKYQLVRCDDEACDTFCKTRPGFSGGACNHYQLCSCYMKLLSLYSRQ